MDAQPLLRYWTLYSPEGHVATCDLVRTSKGLEVRCDWSTSGAHPRVAKAAAIEAVADALSLAEAWKAAYVDKGWAAGATPRSRPH
jgi:hypothetical protein